MATSYALECAEKRYTDACNEERKAYFALREAQEQYNDTRLLAISRLTDFNDAMKTEIKE